MDNDKRHFWMQAGVSAFWSICTAIYIGAITFLSIPPDNVRIVDTVVGFLLGTIVSMIMTYWLGSSLGSKVKDQAKEAADEPTV